MQLVQQLLDYTQPWEFPDVYLFTGNSTRKTNGAIVMGRGAARMVRNHFPGLDVRFGQLIAANPDRYMLLKYLSPTQIIGWFKVKNHWSQPADLKLIQFATEQLNEEALRNPDFRFHMNFPGVGNGRLADRKVLPIIETLPDNVFIYR
jgi:hypothetical protein